MYAYFLMIFILILRLLAFQRCIIVHIKYLKKFENLDFFLKNSQNWQNSHFLAAKFFFNNWFFLEFFVRRISIIYHWKAEYKTFQTIFLFSFQHHVSAEQFRLEDQTTSFPKKNKIWFFLVFLKLGPLRTFKIRWGWQIRIQFFPVNLKLVWFETES